MRPQFTPSDIERFWAKVDKSGPIPAHRPELGPCWLHSGTPSQKYPRIRIGPDRHQAHRFSHMLAHGPIPDGMVVCHHCDNKRCVRPSHLFIGTVADNNRDRDAKGRHGVHTHPERFRGGDMGGPRERLVRDTRGERNGRAKLTSEQAREIRRRFAVGNVLRRDLATEFRVSKETVSLLIRGGTWKDS